MIRVGALINAGDISGNITGEAFDMDGASMAGFEIKTDVGIKGLQDLETGAKYVRPRWDQAAGDLYFEVSNSGGSASYTTKATFAIVVGADTTLTVIGHAARGKAG